MTLNFCVRTFIFWVMNELNLQNPHFLRNVIMADVNNHRIFIHFIYDKKSYYLISKNNVMDNYQVWQTLTTQRELISFNDL
jgi:hypothetical protein